MRSTRARHLAGTITAALLGSTLAFAPAPAPSQAVPSAAASLDARVVDGELRTTVNGLYDRTGLAPDEDVHDAMTWIRAARRLAEAGGMQTMAATDACLPLDGSLTGESAIPDCEGDPGDPDEEWGYSYLEAAGDLDGDGWDDLLEVTVAFTEDTYTESLAARSGRDGALLWSNEVTASDGFGFTATAPDLDGDGGDELLVVEFTEDWTWGESCTPVRCTYSDDFGETVRLTAVDGDTGARLGSTSHDFRVVFSGADTSVGAGDLWAGQYEGSLDFVGALTWLGFVDPEGDGSHQLLRGAVDSREEWTGIDAGVGDEETWDAAYGAHTTSSVTSDVDLTDLTDGSSTTVLADEPALVFAAAARLDGADAIILDAYELDSDDYYGCIDSWTLGLYECGSTADLAQEPPTDGTRTLLGADLQPVWEAPASWDVLAVYGAAGDVTGDGADDLLEAEIDWDTFAIVSNVIDGATGATAWSASIDGGVADDGRLLAVRFTWTEEYTEETWAYEIGAEALVLAGADGSHLTSRPLASVEGRDDGSGTVVDGSIGVGLLPLAGPGVDVLTLAEQYTLQEVDRYEECWEYEDPETGEVEQECWEWIEYEFVELLADLWGHSGGDLAELLHIDLGWDWFLAVVDLDGDGLVEVLVESFDEESGSLHSVARRQDGTTLWTLVDEFVMGVLGAPDGPSLVSADLWSGDTIVRDGGTLAELWRMAGGVSEGVVVIVS